MNRMFDEFTLGDLKIANRFVFPPVKTAYGKPQGIVTERQLTFYQRIANNAEAAIYKEQP